MALLTRAITLALAMGMLIACQSIARAEETSRVFVILSESGQAYQEVAKAFSSTLTRKYLVKVETLDSLQDQDMAQMNLGGNLIVPVGVRAMRKLYELTPSQATIMSLMVPRSAVTPILGDTNRRSRDSAVYIDQPLTRSLAFIHLLLPATVRVGLLLSDKTSDKLATYRQEAARFQMELGVETVASSLEVPQALPRLLQRVDVFLMLPDSVVVNETTVRHILLASYRQQIPVIGFSKGLTSAGAVAAVVSDPSAIGHEGASMANQWNPSTGEIPAARYASEFSLLFNNQVARSLDVVVPEGNQELLKWRARLE
jgi:ABC-type uncharacterized transport system substrate-binding protein